MVDWTTIPLLQGIHSWRIYTWPSSHFVVGLYQGFNILGYARRDEIFPEHSVRALRIIKYCALTTAIFILGAEAYLFIFMRGKDDIAGGVMMGVFVILVSAIIATAAAVFERNLQNAVNKKSENELTVSKRWEWVKPGAALDSGQACYYATLCHSRQMFLVE